MLNSHQVAGVALVCFELLKITEYPAFRAVSSTLHISSANAGVGPISGARSPFQRRRNECGATSVPVHRGRRLGPQRKEAATLS
jgi:hypothetical protein